MKKKNINKKLILNRASRMIGIYLLLRKRPFGLKELAFRFKVNERSIQRDLKLLREAGAPVEKIDYGYIIDTKLDKQCLRVIL